MRRPLAGTSISSPRIEAARPEKGRGAQSAISREAKADRRSGIGEGPGAVAAALRPARQPDASPPAAPLAAMTREGPGTSALSPRRALWKDEPSFFQSGFEPREREAARK